MDPTENLSLYVVWYLRHGQKMTFVTIKLKIWLVVERVHCQAKIAAKL